MPNLIHLQKGVVRKVVKGRLQGTSAASITFQSANIAQLLRGLPEYQKAIKVAYYLHMEANEIETDVMIANAFTDSMCKSSIGCH